jgi:hypothetical protein
MMKESQIVSMALKKIWYNLQYFMILAYIRV